MFADATHDARGEAAVLQTKGVQMKIVVVGRGNVGGGLARLWTRAGHAVTALGREGGDGSHADVVVIAVPGHAIEDALSRVTGIDGKTTIDATNSYSPPGPNPGFPSLVAEGQSIVGNQRREAGVGARGRVRVGGVDRRLAVDASDPRQGVLDRVARDGDHDHVGMR